MLYRCCRGTNVSHSTKFGSVWGGSVYLVVLDGLGERLHVDRLIQLVFVQQVDQEVQGALVHAHLRVQRAHLFVDIHAALRQSPDAHTVSILNLDQL